MQQTLCFLTSDWTLASSWPTSSLDTRRSMSNIQVSTSSASEKNCNTKPHRRPTVRCSIPSHTDDLLTCAQYQATPTTYCHVLNTKPHRRPTVTCSIPSHTDDLLSCAFSDFSYSLGFCFLHVSPDFLCLLNFMFCTKLDSKHRKWHGIWFNS